MLHISHMQNTLQPNTNPLIKTIVKGQKKKKEIRGTFADGKGVERRAYSEQAERGQYAAFRRGVQRNRSEYDGERLLFCFKS